MGVIENMRAAIALQKPERTPVFALSQEFDARISGITYREYVTDAQKAARCQIENIERFGYDWSWVHVDDTIEFEALGVGILIQEDIVPVTVGYLPATPETLRGLRLPNFQKDARAPVFLEMLRQIRGHFGDRICVCGRTAAPFSSAGLIYGSGPFMLLTVDNRQLLRDTMEFCFEMQAEWGRAQVEAGAHALWLGDCYGASYFISPQMFVDFALEPAQRLVKEYHRMGAMVIWHSSEEDEAFLPLEAELGVDVVSIGPGLDIARARELIGDRQCIIGNLDPINVLELGTPEQVAAETRRIFARMAPGNGFIFNTGECVPREVPEENMRAMISTARECGAA